jgi:hypothetical protein
MLKLTYTVGHYGSRTFTADTDSPAEALAQLVALFVEREGSRNPTPAPEYPLAVEFEVEAAS